MKKRFDPRAVLVLLAFSWTPLAFATETHRTFWRGQWVNYVEVGDYAVTEGDIIIGKKEDVRAWRDAVERGQLQTELTRKALTTGDSNKLWNLNDASGVVLVPYTVTTAKPNIDAAIAEVNRVLSGVVRWVPRTGENDYVDFNLATANSGSCASFVGRIGGRQSISGDPECSVGTMVHEMGHAMGLWHVQQDARAANFVDFRLANMDAGKRSNSQPIFGTRTFGGYDYESNMHYSRTAFSASSADRVTLETKPAGITVGTSASYSPSDLDALFRLYGKPPTQTTIQSNPTGLRVIVDGVAHTTPAVFNWPVGSVHRIWVEDGLQTLVGYRFAFGRWSHDASAEPSSQITWQVRAGDGSLGAPSSSPAETLVVANFIRLIDVRSPALAQTGGSFTITPNRAPWPGSTTLYPQFTTFDLFASPAAGFEHYFIWDSAFSSKGGAGIRRNLSLLATGSFASQNIGANFHSGPTIRVNVSELGTEDGVPVKVTPPGGSLSNTTAPRIARITPGTWKFEVANPQLVGAGIRFIPEGNDGFDNAATGEVAMPPSGVRDVTLRVRREVSPFSQVQPSCAGSISRSNSAPWIPTGSSLNVNLVSSGVGVFAGWSGTLTGTQTNATLTVPNNVPEFVARFNQVAEPLTIASVFPSVVGDEAAPITLRIRGTGFTASSQVVIAAQQLSSSYVNSTTLDVTVSRSNLVQGRIPLFVLNALSATCVASSASVGLDVLPAGERAVAKLVEYYNPGFDYYFITTRANEQQALDSAPDWRRTGAQIKLFAAQVGDLAPLERFFFSRIARGGTRGSHFFTSFAYEQRGLAAINPMNTAVDRQPFLESIEGYTIPKLANGGCPEQAIPVYRAFKGEPRYVDDGNHRFSISLAQHRDMVERLGWKDEGIVFCALQ
jgi:hypothetical protein